MEFNSGLKGLISMLRILQFIPCI